MENVETPALIMALLLMFGAIGAKIFTGQIIASMRRQVAEVDRDRAVAAKKLHIAQNQQKIAEQNKVKLTAKKVKLLKKLNRARREVGTVIEDHKARQRRSQANRVQRDKEEN